jgi:methionyl-tRNA formyltransferase
VSARILFMGTPEFAVPCLEVVIAEAHVVGVLTQPDRPKGRGHKLTPSPVKALALTHNIPVFEFTKLKAQETHAVLAQLKPDLAVVVAYGRILPPQLLQLPRLGCINVHASLLPRHRGASPIAHALLAGDKQTGVSIMQLDEGLDTGAVFAERSIDIAPDATTGSLTETLAKLGALLLSETLPGILTQTLVPQPQNNVFATHCKLFSKEDGHLNFNHDAATLERQIRAFSPWPGAFAFLDEIPIQVLKAKVVDKSGESGLVLAADAHGIVIGCSKQALLIEELKPAGRKAMPAAAFVAGRGVDVGARFI